MDKEDDPCDEYSDNDFADCINSELMQRIGCQPHWFYKSENALPLCSNFSQLNTFVINYLKTLHLTPEDFYNKFSCRKPCSYLEYKVNIFKILLKMEESYFR